MYAYGYAYPSKVFACRCVRVGAGKRILVRFKIFSWGAKTPDPGGWRYKTHIGVPPFPYKSYIASIAKLYNFYMPMLSLP